MLGNLQVGKVGKLSEFPQARNLLATDQRLNLSAPPLRHYCLKTLQQRGRAEVDCSSKSKITFEVE